MLSEGGSIAARPWDEPPVLGVVEGFYGRPWSWSARRRLVESIAPLGFGLYVYAPKDDPLHRAQWRDRYFPEELCRFERLVRRCREVGMDFAFGVHPVDMRGGVAELERLHEKARQLQAIGVESFCLLFDDLPSGAGTTDGQRAASALRHARAANALLSRLRDSGPCRRLMLVPTEYHGLRPGSAYLRALGGELAAEIDVFWTGTDVCSRTIAVEEVERLTATLGRRPMIWDNYPVNDTQMQTEAHIRPLIGRAPELPSLVRGFVANAANQAEASCIALHTLAAWWHDPRGYDPERAWDEALLAATGRQAGAAALRLLGELARRSPLEPEPVSLPALDGFVSALVGGGSGAGADRAARVAVESARWRAAAELLLDPASGSGGGSGWRLRGELGRWSRKLLAWAEAVDAALASLEAEHPAARATARRTTLARARAARRIPAWVADEQIDSFVRRVLWNGALATDGEAPATNDALTIDGSGRAGTPRLEREAAA